MEKKDLLHAGKAKSMYKTEDPDKCIMHFRDDASAFDGVKRAQLGRKGLVNNRFNAHMMEYLEGHGVKTHFVELLSDTDSLVHKLKMFPVECVIRNYAAGSLCRRLGIKEARKMNMPIIEFFLKDDDLHDPMINEDHILEFGWATGPEIMAMKKVTFDVNTILSHLFQQKGMLLVDFKLEFGVHKGQDILLGDEFTPDGARIWDAKTKKSLDKDRFRKDMGDVIESYEEVASRLDIDIE